MDYVYIRGNLVMHLPKSNETKCVKTVEILWNLNCSKFKFERPVDKFFKDLDSTYNFPQIRKISQKEREQMMILTFKLGNNLVHDFSNDEIISGHSYNLKRIEITDEMIEAIEEAQKKYCC